MWEVTQVIQYVGPLASEYPEPVSVQWYKGDSEVQALKALVMAAANEDDSFTEILSVTLTTPNERKGI